MNPDHLRTAIERIGVEKPSDYTLVMEEVGRMEAEEKLVERLEALANSGDYFSDDDLLREAAQRLSSLSPLLHAASLFIEEAERMGWGKTSETWLPPSFDNLKAAVEGAKR